MINRLGQFDKEISVTWEGIGHSTQQSFFTALYRSSLLVGKIITANWTYKKR